MNLMMLKRNFLNKKVLFLPIKKRFTKKLNTKVLDGVFGEIKSYLSMLRNKEGKVVNFKTDDELKKMFDFGISDNKGISDEEVIRISKMVLDYSVHAGHPNYFNTLFGGFSEYSLIGDYIQSTLNGSVFTFESAPIFTLMEEEVGKKYAEMLKWEKYDFILCPGGSFANLYALITSRFNKFPTVKFEGIKNLPQMNVFTSELSHYSIDKGAMVLGLGKNNIIKVKTDERGRMIPSDLEEKIKICIEKGQAPMMVNSTMGTTVFGANDPLEENSTICEKYDIWHHIDAAYGGAQLFLDDFRKQHELAFAQSDSMSMDQHKVLNIPQQSTIFLTQHEDILDNCNSTHAGYLFMQDKVLYDFHLDTGDKSIQCSRHIDIFKLWLYWKVLSTEGLKDLIKKALDHAKYLAKLIKDHKNFELIVEPEYLTVCFFYIPDHILYKQRDEAFWKEVDQICPKIKAEMIKRGNTMISYQKQQSSYKSLVNFLRPSITLGKEREDIEFLLKELVEIGEIVSARDKKKNKE